LRTYGVDRDDSRIAFYRLLYDTHSGPGAGPYR
jgi:hypothetical protein